MNQTSIKLIKKNSSIIRSRKGFTYLIVTTVIVAVLLCIFFSANRYKYQDQERLEQVRIRAMNDFVKSLDNDIHRATYISTFRALLALEDNVALKKTYLTSINDSFRETFFYGTINGTDSTMMHNSTFSDYLSKVQEIASSNGMILNVNVTRIGLMQSNPWAIDVYVTMNITIADTKNTASWNISKEYVTSVPIVNLRDPLYSKNIQVPNTIRQLNTSSLVIGNDTIALQTHIVGSYYLASNYSPNFIMRFEGLSDPDANGIESIVYIMNMSTLINSSAHDWSYYVNRTKVDYLFFNDSVVLGTQICNVPFVPTDLYFVVPSDRAEIYNLTGLNYSTCSP
jgi:hypothetical protein